VVTWGVFERVVREAPAFHEFREYEPAESL
jgi:hypothetical protein